MIYEQQKRLQKETDKDELVLLRLLDEEYTRHPFDGSHRMKQYLGECGYSINRKRVQRLMQKLGLVGMSPGPNTSKAHPQHKIYPYRLRGVDIIQPNQVWSTDITTIRLPRGFVFRVAIIDWYSRKVLSWRLSNTMAARFCIACLEEVITLYGNRPFSIPTRAASHQRCLTSLLPNNRVTIRMDRYLLLQYRHFPHPCGSWTKPGTG